MRWYYSGQVWRGPGKEEKGDGVSLKEDMVTMRGGVRERRKKRGGEPSDDAGAIVEEERCRSRWRGRSLAEECC